MSVFAGIDPGLDGFVCLLAPRPTGEPLLQFFPMPVLGRKGQGKRSYDVQGVVGLALTLKDAGLDLVAVERQQAFPKIARGRSQGVVSSFQVGYGYGLLIASLAAAGLSYEEVLPTRWKSSLACLGGGGGREEANARMVMRAQALFPSVDLRPLETAPGSRTPSPDKAAAALLSEYARRLRSSGAISPAPCGAACVTDQDTNAEAEWECKLPRGHSGEHGF